MNSSSKGFLHRMTTLSTWISLCYTSSAITYRSLRVAALPTERSVAMMTTFQALALMIAFGGLIVSIINVSQKRKCDNEKK